MHQNLGHFDDRSRGKVLGRWGEGSTNGIALVARFDSARKMLTEQAENRRAVSETSQQGLVVETMSPTPEGTERSISWCLIPRPFWVSPKRSRLPVRRTQRSWWRTQDGLSSRSNPFSFFNTCLAGIVLNMAAEEMGQTYYSTFEAYCATQRGM